MGILKADVEFSTHINHWRAAQVDHDHGPRIIQNQGHEKQSDYDYGQLSPAVGGWAQVRLSEGQQRRNGIDRCEKTIP